MPRLFLPLHDRRLPQNDIDRHEKSVRQVAKGWAVGPRGCEMGRRWDVGDRAFEWECWEAMGSYRNLALAAPSDSFLVTFSNCGWADFYCR